jgi:hypothetical protein
MIPPREKVLVAIPAHDSKLDFEVVTGLMQCLPYFAQPLFLGGCSHVALARNKIAHLFVEKATEFEWLMLIDSDMGFTPDDWRLLWEGEELIVCADYSKKFLGQRPTGTGLGFTRVHRSVFDKLKNLMTEDGKEFLKRFYMEGQMYVDYFPSGVVMDGRWLGEDQGFFMLCSLVTDSIRWEKRTQLKHIGRFAWGYPNCII